MFGHNYCRGSHFPDYVTTKTIEDSKATNPVHFMFLSKYKLDINYFSLIDINVKIQFKKIVVSSLTRTFNISVGF